MCKLVNGVDPKLCQPFRSLGPHTPQCFDGTVTHDGHPVGIGELIDASWFRQPGSDLGALLVVTDTYRARQPGLRQDDFSDLFGDFDGVVGSPGRHREVSLVPAPYLDRVTGKLDSFAPEAKVIHADIDPAEIGKNRHADVPIVGDVKAVITELIAMLRHHHIPGTIEMADWWAYLNGVRKTYPLSYGPQSDGSLSPEYVIEKLGEIAGPDAVFVAGVGQHQMWAAQFIRYEKPRSWLNSGGLGTMGFAIPAAMGAKIALPGTEVWAIDGDGCFQMTNQELATCAVEGIPVKVALINNGNLGMVRQWQSLFYAERYSQTDLATHSHRIPDFVKLAEALGCVGLRCEREEDVVDVINQARAINDCPVVIDFIVGADAQVWPMVAAGTSNDEIQAARGIRPLFDDITEGHA